MATTTPVSFRPRFRLPRLLGWLLGALLLAALGLCAWIYSLACSALPQLDGRLQAAGLIAPVSVRRDAHGVPTLEAANLDDLFFAQGYITAQDRLFQMDGMRRYAAGELAEVFGGDYLEHDRQQRILGLRVVARKTIQIAPAEDRS